MPLARGGIIFGPVAAGAPGTAARRAGRERRV